LDEQIFVKGSTKINYKLSEKTKEKQFDDKCKGNSELWEYYCIILEDEIKLAVKAVKCSEGCKNSAC
jgi:hypothetical protein